MTKKGIPKYTPNTTLPTSKIAEYLRFSFTHLDLRHERFAVVGKDDNYFISVLERLKNISSWTANEFRNTRSKSIRSHTIAWEDASEPDGFSHLNEQMRQLPAFQFEISSNSHGRVHGLLLDNTFYVVWLDPEHKLYP
jgi:hypothetical protein